MMIEKSNYPFLDSLLLRMNLVDSLNKFARFEFSKHANEFEKEFYFELGKLVNGNPDTVNAKITFDGLKAVKFENNLTVPIYRKYILYNAVADLLNLKEKKLKTHLRRIYFAYSPLIIETQSFYILDYCFRQSKWFKTHYF